MADETARTEWKISKMEFEVTGIHSTNILSRLSIEEITTESFNVINFDSMKFKNPKYVALVDTISQNRSRLPDLKMKDNSL